MRQLILSILAGLFAVNSHAQVSGNAKDTQGVPVKGATISLLAAKDSAIVKLAVTAATGDYLFSTVKAGSYLVKASYVDHLPAFSAPIEVSTDAIKVPELKLSKSTGNLKEVVVVAQKPLVEIKADKMVVNVEGTINAVGSDALELLRKSPGVLVDKDDNLSLSGKNGVQVYIDGKPSPLSGQDLAAYLRSLNSSQVEAIEIIANPSAKYEAAGNAGIINIRLKKNKSFGTNGSVNAGWNIGEYAKYNAGVNLNYRNKKINLFGTYGFNKGRMENNLNISRSVADSLFNQEAIVHVDNRNHNFKAGLDYFMDKKNTIGVLVNGSLSDPAIKNKSVTPITYIPTNTVDRLLVADNSSVMKRNNVNVNLNYSFNNGKGKSLVVNADHGSFDINTNQFQPNYYYDATGKTILSSVVYRMIAPTDISINSLKADWEQPFKKGTLGFGGKTAFVKTDNDFQRYDVIAGNDRLDKDRSNRFEYKENISALYVNYNRAFKGITLQAGLRMEHTGSEGLSNGQKPGAGGYVAYSETFKRSYTDLFPSASITFNKKPTNQFSLTYSRRIDRPGYQDLNPFEFKLDEYTFQKGNINLRPQYTNSIGLTNTYKYKLTTTLNYSHVKDLFTQVFDTAEGSKAFISKRNLATQDIVSLNISYPFRYKAYSLFANVNSFYTSYHADFGTGRQINVKATGLSMYVQNSIKFAKTFTAELTGFYNAPTVYQGTVKARSLWSVDAGLQKQVLKGKGTFKASVSDIFQTLKFRGVSDFAGQRSDIRARWESRQFKLNFVYRFGSSQVKAARQRTTGADDESKRAQGGGGVAPGVGQ
ncbi:MAG: TonB-dependent receptor [Chitinophagaceae bacterium]|nr:TonB-dependent receptor [Chitinophagaceae bacterium]